MFSEGAIVKATLVPAGVFVTAEVLPKILNEGFGAVAVTAAGIAGIGYLFKRARRGLGAARAFAGRIHEGIDVIETVPGRLDKIEARLDEGDKRFEVMADAEALRIKDAIAGDRRSPADRRARPAA